MELAAVRAAGAPPDPSDRSRPERAVGAEHPTALVGAIPRTSGWVVPAMGLGASLVVVPLMAAAAVALHATSWGDLVALGLGAALVIVGLVLVPLQLRFASLARRRTDHWWRQAELTAEREAELSAEREELLHNALLASDRERRQLAADLHDGVIQLVSAVTLRTATLSPHLSPHS